MSGVSLPNHGFKAAITTVGGVAGFGYVPVPLSVSIVVAAVAVGVVIVGAIVVRLSFRPGRAASLR